MPNHGTDLPGRPVMTQAVAGQSSSHLLYIHVYFTGLRFHIDIDAGVNDLPPSEIKHNLKSVEYTLLGAYILNSSQQLTLVYAEISQIINVDSLRSDG
ncbi:hypothetical protein PHET_01427 [Paragonimus heterotremus]|uniref:Uncharacterized protein n=1 Tax=Paragonimus heterotremus TaxID=100268 RepID=A0A8J4WUM3_9TREM|nr:hypothetical protein PHET_01427 [Paragonimus heterotremus]